MHAVNFPGMRNINRSIVLNMIREHGPISRSEIARRSELAPSAVSNIVSELLSLGLSGKVGSPGRAGAVRRPS